MSSEALERTPEQHTLEELHPAAYRCWKRLHAKLPPSDPSDHDDPSVNLDTLAAILHATLAALAVAREREQHLTEGLGRAYRDSDTGERCVIARLCDDYLDRSGALLGRVRAAALADEPAAASETVSRPNEWTAHNIPEFEYREPPASAAADEPGETAA